MNDVTERTETIVPGPAEGLAALLGVPPPDPESGAGLPLLWHWIYLLDRPAQSDLGVDGHPARGTIPAPPEPGRRRMWAGGSVRALGPLRYGEPAIRRTEVISTQDKWGRSGRLTFVSVRHRISQRDSVVIDERQDIVYRDVPRTPADPGPETAPVVAPLAPGDREVPIDPTLLFRFSALTYNGHRIHYDRDYAREVEGYPGLLTHGPLQAVLMAEEARARFGDTGVGKVFDYRLVAPLFDGQGLVVRADAEAAVVHTAARDRYGRRTATGVLTTL